MSRMNVADTIRQKLSDALKKIGIEVSVQEIVLEYPSELEHGDYANNAAMRYGKQLSIAPRALAENITAALGEIEGVSKIEVAGPGFINFTLASSALAASIESARADGRGTSDSLAGEEVIFEYTSPNLFKPLHIGNLVGNITGESLTRLFENAGAVVHRVNYPSDIGLTVAKGVWGLKKAGSDPCSIEALGEAYRAGNAAYENDEVAKKEIEAINKALYEDSDPGLSALRSAGIETSRRHLDEICERLGTKFDTEIFESQASPIGYEIVMAHMADGIFEKSDGAIIFPEAQSGLHTRVFINSAGLTTYEAKDLGNFKLKNEAFPTWTQSYVVTGVEQLEYFKVIIAAIKKIFPETAAKKIAHIPTGFLTLTTGKMSSRLGNVLTGESLIADLEESAKERAAESRAHDIEQLANDIAVAALKYDVLKQGNGKNIIFDKEHALSLEGDSGPYLQYSYARSRAIVEKAREQGIAPHISDVARFGASEMLVRLLVRFPMIIERATEDLQPHTIAHYLIDVASAFNAWYAQEQILDGTDAAAQKVAIVEATGNTIREGLYLLGIPAPEKM